MTIREVSSQLYDLTNGRVNGIKYSRTGLEQVIRMWMRGDLSRNKLSDTHVIEVSLPDGKWLAAINKFSDRADGYELFIPDDRDEEAIIYEALTR